MQYCRQSFLCCNPDPALLVKSQGYQESSEDFFLVCITSPPPYSEYYCVFSYSSLFPPFACSPQPLVLLIFLTPRESLSTLSLIFASFLTNRGMYKLSYIELGEKTELLLISRARLLVTMIVLKKWLLSKVLDCLTSHMNN